MPTVAISSRVSDAVYILSILLVGLLLARPVFVTYSASQERAAEVVAAGVGKMIDSMSPGTRVVTSLESFPSVHYSVELSGNSVIASFGRSAATDHVRWSLSHTVIHPGLLYAFTLEGGMVEVAQARNG
jgi:hypothetical protein